MRPNSVVKHFESFSSSSTSRMFHGEAKIALDGEMACYYLASSDPSLLA